MTTDQSPASGPLAGVRVLELSNQLGQWCGKLMADFGADVIKIEPPGGVAERQVGPFYKDIEDPNRSLYFRHYNTSKKSVTLDLSKEEGRDLFRRLPRTADVILETTQPGTLPTLGLGYDSLAADNPRLRSIQTNSISLTTLTAGLKHNVIPAVAEATLDWREINDAPRKYEAVTAADIRRVAKQYFAPTNRSVATFVRQGAPAEEAAAR